MRSEVLSAIDNMQVQIVLGLVLGLGFIMLRVWLFWRRLIRRRQEIERHKDAGTIGPAAMIQGATLPWHYDRLARIGTSRPAELSLDQRILRPSIGVRLLVLGLCATMFYLSAQTRAGEMKGLQIAEPGPYGTFMVFLGLFAAVSGMLYVFTFETRYDRNLLIVTRMMFFRREYRWNDLWQIADDGAYELQLHFRPGGTAKVLKHSVGIEEFKDFALAQIRRNRLASA
jgi:hypothetical protein